MYRLWRAGYFEAQTNGLVASVADDLPAEVEATIRLPQYPWVTGVDGENRLRIFMGPLTASVTPRGSMPISLGAAAVLSASVSLQNGNDLVFEGIQIERLALNFFGADYVLPIQQIVEQTVSRLLQGIIDRALNDGLPSLPLPEFVIPDGLGGFDLPAGTRIGLRQPRLQGLIHMDARREFGGIST